MSTDLYPQHRVHALGLCTQSLSASLLGNYDSLLLPPFSSANSGLVIDSTPWPTEHELAIGSKTGISFMERLPNPVPAQ